MIKQLKSRPISQERLVAELECITTRILVNKSMCSGFLITYTIGWLASCEHMSNFICITYSIMSFPCETASASNTWMERLRGSIARFGSGQRGGGRGSLARIELGLVVGWGSWSHTHSSMGPKPAASKYGQYQYLGLPRKWASLPNIQLFWITPQFLVSPPALPAVPVEASVKTPTARLRELLQRSKVAGDFYFIASR